MTKISPFVLLFLLLSNLIFAQQKLEIQVKDPSKENLNGLVVNLTGADTSKIISSSISDLNGVVVFPIKSFPISIKISGIGYESYFKTLDKMPNGIFIIQLVQKINSLTEIVVTGVGRPTKLDEAVSVYKIISAKDIKSQGAVNLQDALQNQLGINIGQDALLGGTIRMQGLSGDNVKILVDGLPINGREGQNIDLSTLNLNNIEKIEIAQGPMSVMYGADALGGVINLITHSNDKSMKAAANAFYETIGKYNVGVDVAKQIKKHNISFGIGRNFFQGWDPVDNEKRDPLWRPKQQYLGNLKYTYRFSNDASLTFGTDYLNDLMPIKGSAETYSFYNRFVRDDYFTTQRWMNRLQAKWKSGDNGYWESNNSFSLYNRTRTSYFTDLSTMQRNLSTYPGDQSITQFNDYTLRTTYNNREGIFSYTFGYDINLEYGNSADKISGGQKHVGDYALMLITDFDIHKKLKLQPALRAAWNSQYNAPLIPSFSILYKPYKDFQFRGSYARGFRAPTLKEMFLDFEDTNHDILGNKNLHPEDGQHFQISSAYTLYQEKENYNNISFTAYYNDVHNQITLAQTGVSLIPGTPEPYTYVNIGYFRNLQFQLISQNQYKQFYVALGGSFNHSIPTISSAGYDYWEANANFRYSFPKIHGSIAIFYKYTGPAPLLVADITGGSAIEKGVLTNQYHNLDASFEKSIYNDKIHFVIGVKNIFNNTIIGSTGTSTNPIATSPHGSSDGTTNLSTGRSYFISLKMALYK